MIFLLPFDLNAHGVRGDTGRGGIAVTASYDTGEAMSYARTKIMAPGSKLVFQSGRTDRNGRFCFFPDAQGDWRVVVDDEMGHRLALTVAVGKGLEPEKKGGGGESSQPSLTRFEKILMGLSIIFGLSGIFFWWRGRRERGRP